MFFLDKTVCLRLPAHGKYFEVIINLIASVRAHTPLGPGNVFLQWPLSVQLCCLSVYFSSGVLPCPDIKRRKGIYYYYYYFYYYY